MKTQFAKPFAILMLMLVLASLACNPFGGGPALPLRSDMGTDGLTDVLVYGLVGPAGTDKEVNTIELRGLNDFAPRRQLQTVFGKMSGSKTQDIVLTRADGSTVVALGMIKTKRFGGYSRFMTVV